MLIRRTILTPTQTSLYIMGGKVLLMAKMSRHRSKPLLTAFCFLVNCVISKLHWANPGERINTRYAMRINYDGLTDFILFNSENNFSIPVDSIINLYLFLLICI